LGLTYLKKPIQALRDLGCKLGTCDLVRRLSPVQRPNLHRFISHDVEGIVLRRYLIRPGLVPRPLRVQSHKNATMVVRNTYLNTEADSGGTPMKHTFLSSNEAGEAFPEGVRCGNERPILHTEKYQFRVAALLHGGPLRGNITPLGDILLR